MAKDKLVTRVDVRIPNDIYSQIEAIAIETNQPLHHRSGKPVEVESISDNINDKLSDIQENTDSQSDSEDKSDKSAVEDESEVGENEADYDQGGAVSDNNQDILSDNKANTDETKTKDNSEDVEVETESELSKEEIPADSLTFEDTEKEIKRLNDKGMNYSQIAKELTDKYPTKQGKYNWAGNQVKRILDKT